MQLSTGRPHLYPFTTYSAVRTGWNMTNHHSLSDDRLSKCNDKSAGITSLYLKPALNSHIGVKYQLIYNVLDGDQDLE